MAYSTDHFLVPSSDAPAQPAPAAFGPVAPSPVLPLAPSSSPAAPAGPPWPNPLASICYASCRPADCEPPAEDAALTSRAAYERLNRAAARAETLVLYRLDMLSGCRDSLDVDQTRLEASIQNLWRLTAVRKTLLSIEAALSAPPKPAPPSGKGVLPLAPAIFNDDAAQAADAQPEATGAEHVAALLDQAGRVLAEIEAEEAQHSAFLSPSPSPSCSQSEFESPSPSRSRSQSQSIPSIQSIGSIRSMESISPVSESPSPQVPESSPSHPSHPSHSSHNPQSSVAESPSPQVSLSSSLFIREVPCCPNMSLSSVGRTLERVNADMANYTVHTSTAADYNYGNTAEEFFNGSPKSAPKSAPKSSPKSTSASAPTVDPAPAALDDDAPDSLPESTLLADPTLSPSLKSQLSIHNSSPITIRNPQSAIPLPLPLLPTISNLKFQISNSPPIPVPPANLSRAPFCT